MTTVKVIKGIALSRRNALYVFFKHLSVLLEVYEMLLLVISVVHEPVVVNLSLKRAELRRGNFTEKVKRSWVPKWFKRTSNDGYKAIKGEIKGRMMNNQGVLVEDGNMRAD